MWKRKLELFAVWLFLAPILGFFVWCNRIINDFHLVKPYGPVLKATLPQAFTAPGITPITYSSLTISAVGAAFLLWLVYLFENPHRKGRSHVRGASIADKSVLIRAADANTFRNKMLSLRRLQQFSTEPVNVLRHYMTPVQQLTIAGVPIPPELEPLHFLIGGTTGAGKSTAIKEVLARALDRGDRATVVDPNGEYFSLFGRRNDVIMNPFDRRFPGWSIFNEIRETYDAERYARSVIPDARGANDQEWHGYAQFLFQETILKLREDGHKSTDTLIHYLCSLEIEALGAYLENTLAIGLFDEGANKALSSTRFILTKYLSSHKHLRDGEFSLRDWLEQDTGNLYITWRENMVDALRPLISTWFDILVSSTLSMPIHGKPRPLWFCCDELASMERLSSLEDGLTKGRKHGARFLCGVQSTAQLDDIYGREKSQTLRSCFRSSYLMNIPTTDPATAEEFSKGIGEREYIRTERSRTHSSDGINRQVSQRHVRERLVLPSDIHSLPNLAGYLCFAGDYPISLATLEPYAYPVRNKAFMES
jgi:hypothetical protein